MLMKSAANRLFVFIILILCVLSYLLPVFGQRARKPVSQRGLLAAARMGQSTRDMVELINKIGVDFTMNASIERELTNAKIRPEVLKAARNNYRGSSSVSNAAAGRTSKTPPSNTTSANIPVNNSSAISNNGYFEEDQNTESYEQLYFQAGGLFNQLKMSSNPQQANGIAQNIENIGNQAIRMSPNRPEAYTIIGYLALLKGDMNTAERYAQESLNRGGTLRFGVYHLAGTPHLEILYIHKDYISVESGQKYFPFDNREVNKIEPQNSINVAGRDVAVFMICTNKDNNHSDWYFSPADTGTAQEANLIMRLIQKNNLAGR